MGFICGILLSWSCNCDWREQTNWCITETVRRYLTILKVVYRSLIIIHSDKPELFLSILTYPDVPLLSGGT